MNSSSKHPDPNVVDRLVGRKIRIGLKIRGSELVERVLPPNADIVFGAGGPGVIAVARWSGENHLLISCGRWLMLGPGMSVIMCHESGEGRVDGTYDELVREGMSFPAYINVSRLNIRVRPGVVMLMEYIPCEAKS